MRCLVDDEIDVVAGGDWQETCQVLLMGGAILGMVGVTLYAAPAWLTVDATVITADTLFSTGTGGYTSFSAAQIASGTAAMQSLVRAGGIVSQGAGTMAAGAGYICSRYG